MGDRCSVVVEYESDFAVVLYSHWKGPEVYADVQTVLKQQVRWHDAPYLARMIFCEMVKNDMDGETGFGILGVEKSNCYDMVVDSNYPFCVVNCAEQTVRIGAATWTFDSFINSAL